MRGGTTRLKKKEEDTDGEFDVYCVRKRFSFCVLCVRRSVVIRSASVRVRRDARRRRRNESEAPSPKKKERAVLPRKKKTFLRVPWT